MMYLIVSSLQVVRGTLLNFQRHIGIVLEILGQPHCREVTPSQLLNDDISLEEDLANMDGMVACMLITKNTSNLVILHALVLAIVFLVQLVEHLLELLVQRVLLGRSLLSSIRCYTLSGICG